MRLLSIMAAAAMLSAALVARADTYSFSFGSTLSGSGSFTLDPVAGQISYTLTTGLSDLTATYGGANITFTDINGPTMVTTDGGQVTGLYSLAAGSDAGLEVGYAVFDGSSFSSAFTTTTNHYEFDASSITFQDTTVTPEPSSFLLLGTGVLGLAGIMRVRFA